MFKINSKFIIFLIAILFFTFSMGSKLPYTVLYATILILIFALVQILVQIATMKVKVQIENKIYNTNDEIKICTIINSISIIPAAYYFVYITEFYNYNNRYNGDMIPLSTRNEKTITNKISFRIRGTYKLNLINIIFTDLFSVVKAKKSFNLNNCIKVYPRIFKVNEKYLCKKTFWENYSNNFSTSKDSNDERDCRKYREGDSLKKVHWKLTAKYNEIYIKNFTEKIHRDSNIFLNMNNQVVVEDYPGILEEEMVEFCASLVSYFINNNEKVNLFISNLQEQYFKIENWNDFHILMEYFVENKNQGSNKFGAFINSKLRNAKQGAYIRIISVILDKELRDQISLMIDLGFVICVFYCIESEYIKDTTLAKVEFIKCSNVIIGEEYEYIEKK